VLDNYQNQLTSQEWLDLLSAKRFDFRDDSDLWDQIRISVGQGLGRVSKKAREAAWALMLRIDKEDETYDTYA